MTTNPDASSQHPLSRDAGDGNPARRDTLELLAHAYESAGWSAQLVDTVVELARIVEREHDAAAAVALRNTLEKHGRQDPAGRDAIALLDRLAAEDGPDAAPDGEAARGAIGAAHPCFALDKLLASGLLTKSEYVSAAEELAGTPVLDRSTPLSALHVLEKREVMNLVNILAFMSEDTGVPLLPLSRFTPQPAARSLLPAPFAAHRGAMAFDTMADSLLVALLNPYDIELRDEVAAASGQQHCLFYLVMASEYDAALRALEGDAESVPEPTGNT